MGNKISWQIFFLIFLVAVMPTHLFPVLYSPWIFTETDYWVENCVTFLNLSSIATRCSTLLNLTPDIFFSQLGLSHYISSHPHTQSTWKGYVILSWLNRPYHLIGHLEYLWELKFRGGMVQGTGYVRYVGCWRCWLYFLQMCYGAISLGFCPWLYFVQLGTRFFSGLSHP